MSAAGSPGKKPQYMEALDRANKVRLTRAATKRSVARGDIPAADVILECPWEVESMAIGELLNSQRRWGRTRTRKFLLGVALNENKPIGKMTPRQRALVAALLKEKKSDQ